MIRYAPCDRPFDGFSAPHRARVRGVACLTGCARFLAPRAAIAVLVVTGDYVGRACETTLWPLLGFVFLPLTTLAYAWAINDLGGARGLGLAVIVLATFLDLGLLRRPRQHAS